VKLTTHADPLYQQRCMESGEPPRLFGVEPPKPRIQAVRIVDMSGSNAWAEFDGIFALTRAAYLEHEQARIARSRRMPPLERTARNQYHQSSRPPGALRLRAAKVVLQNGVPKLEGDPPTLDPGDRGKGGRVVLSTGWL
jgi:hypothetical protein